jgi:RNA polymerase sigma-70 factor (ECF subfamily)
MDDARERRVQEPDPALIRAASRGNVEAFEQLVRDHQQPVARFLHRMLGDATVAEDVTQDTFVRVFRRLASFSFESKFSTWLLQIARNAGIDEIRRRQRHARLAAALPRPSAGVTGAADARVELQAALSTLPERLRTPLLLVEMLGLRYREVAEVLQVPEGTVKSRVFHARTQMQRWSRAGDAPSALERSADEM